MMQERVDQPERPGAPHGPEIHSASSMPVSPTTSGSRTTSRAQGFTEHTRAREPTAEPPAVQLWWMPSGSEGDDEAAASALLDDDELARAGRFRFERDRVRFVKRHAFVRRVLAQYLDVAPAEITIRLTRFGRPELDPVSGISFSVSHADELTVVAVARGCRVGVDIERLRPMDDGLEIAQTMFAEAEVAFLRSVPPSLRAQAFLELWTRKESVVKAVGRGLSLELDRFSVVERDGHLTERAQGDSGALPLTIRALDAPPGYIGAIAVGADQFELTDRSAAEVAVR